MDRGNACRMQILEKLSLVENRRLNLVSNYSLSRNSEKLWHFWQQLLKIHVGQVYLIYAPKCGLLLFSWFCFLVHFGHVCFTCVFGICHRTDRGFSFMCFHTVHTSANELKTRQTFGNIRLLLTFIGITGVVSAVWLICQSLSRSVVANKSHSRRAIVNLPYIRIRVSLFFQWLSLFSKSTCRYRLSRGLTPPPVS